MDREITRSAKKAVESLPALFLQAEAKEKAPNQKEGQKEQGFENRAENAREKKANIQQNVDAKDERRKTLDKLNLSLPEVDKPTWESLTKEQRQAAEKMQDAVIYNDQAQLKKLARDLSPEEAEKITRLVKDNLAKSGARVSLDYADRRFLLYGQGAKEAVLIGANGDPVTVAIDHPNGAKGPPHIRENWKPFKSARSLGQEIAEQAIREMYNKEKVDEALRMPHQRQNR